VQWPSAYYGNFAWLDAPLRRTVNDLQDLVTALNIRFLPHLEPTARLLQVEAPIEGVEHELARLGALSEQATSSGDFGAWI